MTDRAPGPSPPLLHPGVHAAARPDHPAVLMGSDGVTITYAEIEARSNRLAHLLRARGLHTGDHLAVLLANEAAYFEVCWAGQRAGLHTTPVNWHLTGGEAGYIIEDSGARAVVTSRRFAELAAELGPYVQATDMRLAVGGGVPSFETYEDAVASQPATPIDDQSEGALMLYSSGTTGRPKGIERPLAGDPFGTEAALVGLLGAVYGFGPDSVYLCPAPLYHAAPIGWSMAVQRLGGTVVVMERFDPEECLALVERHRVTHAQFVPTHFVRMLKLDPAVRDRYDTSSLRVAVHAAAPCPVDVKRAMFDWWGPVLHEYYAGSEGNGFVAIGPDEWLAHPGSVGRPLLGKVHIVDEDGGELRPGEEGQVWFESPGRFEYHNDPDKTAGAFDARGWSTLGDIGRLDDDGYLYLTDRASHMIISGGVNIYPREAEDVLISHPAVADVAVIGVPESTMGEQVLAVVELVSPGSATPDLADELIAYCRDRVAHYKCPRAVEIVDSLPRLPSGKLLKRELRDRYSSWSAAAGLTG